MGKNIVICADGTGQAGLGRTNVWRLFSSLDLIDPERQVACYDPGVGTIHDPAPLVAATGGASGAVWTPTATPPPLFFRLLRQGAGLAVGSGLFQNVRELYEVVVDHYEEDDRIYLFGFSRGAFTVRVLAGLIYRCGVLRPEHRHRYPEAFALYKPHLEGLTPGARDRLQARIAAFRSAFAKRCEAIPFMGLWDTVKSVGYLWPKSLPHTRRNPIVRTVRHALSIAESRSFFVPTTWGGLDRESQPPVEGQDVREIWFAGGHTDVGGGYDVKAGDLSAFALRWIGDEAVRRGLLVDRSRYGALFAEGLTPPFEAHDELDRWGWKVSEHVPRWELENDPPPPRRRFRWGPSGRRPIGRFARNGAVLVEAHAEAFYGADAPLWDEIRSEGVRVVFVVP